jgi:Asp-tRNA(Asn)/Glu-tRNA(Gln) amidotransferase B subunit
MACREAQQRISERPMPSTRSELDSMLDELERDLQMVMMNSDESDDVLGAFAGQADRIEASAGAADAAHVRERIKAILGSQGIMAPTGDTSEPA